MFVTEYPTLTALMAGREPGSVKVCLANIVPSDADTFRVGRLNSDGTRDALDSMGFCACVYDKGPWLLVSEDAPAIELRLEIAAKVLAARLGRISGRDESWANGHAYSGVNRYAWALAEADALIKEARK